MLDTCIAEVKQQGLQNETEIRAVLLKRVKVYNYVPPSVEGHYTDALVEEYRRASSPPQKNNRTSGIDGVS